MTAVCTSLCIMTLKLFTLLAYFLKPNLFHVVCPLIHTLQLVYGVCSLHWLSDALGGHNPICSHGYKMPFLSLLSPVCPGVKCFLFV